MAMKSPPYNIDKNSLIVAYYASAEMGCHIFLGWDLPVNLLDLFTEFRTLTNGLPSLCGDGLMGALTRFGLSGVEVVERDSIRRLALSGGPWTPAEKSLLLANCESEVEALAKLLPRMEPNLDMQRAPLRGQYMKATAKMQDIGIPIDTQAFKILKSHWANIQDDLIEEVDAEYGVFEDRTFKSSRFATYLTRNNIPWPRNASGSLDLTDDTFREMARSNPQITPLRELRVALCQMCLSDLAVGADGRNRCVLNAFRARTSRNQPSNSRFIFGPAVWLRGLIRPEPGRGLAYIDWSQQEFGIAAALSGDPNMLAAYNSGDPYLTFAKQAGAVPPDSTKRSHPLEREQFKACTLAVQYGMGEASLATRLGQPVAQARELLRLHKQVYRKFWEWSDAAVDYAMLHGKLWTTFGWTVHTVRPANPRFFRNFPMQANGAEMLRTACCLALNRGIRVCAPVHDAILIEAPLDELDEAIVTAQKAMSDASAAVLAGCRLGSEAKIIRYPERYMDPRGTKMWETVWSILGRLGVGLPV
ncbi:MAG: DNA polymerase [Desulfobaccales bacterium]